MPPWSLPRPASAGARRWLVVAIAAVSTLLLPATLIAGPFSAEARRLAELRSEVERLDVELTARRGELLAERKGLVEQRRELDLALERERLRLQGLRAEKERRAVLQEQAREQASLLVPVLREQVALMATVVREGLPFRQQERLAALAEIDEQLERGRLSGPSALARLWQVVEDELRLGRESGLHPQVVLFDGERQLVQMARLGMVALYLRTNDGRFGVAWPRGEGAFAPLDDPAQREALTALFDGLTKGLRQGDYLIPPPPLSTTSAAASSPAARHSAPDASPPAVPRALPDAGAPPKAGDGGEAPP